MSTRKKQKKEPSGNAAFFARIEKLKLARNWTWTEAAKRLHMTRMMLHLIKTEKSGVSKRNLYRLEQLEIEEGLRLPGARVFIESLVSSFEDAKVQLTASDFDRGYVEMPIEYARGEPPKGYPATVRLVRPGAKSSAKLVAELLLDEDRGTVVLSCIQPVELANQGFLNMLTPFSYEALTEAAMALVFGAHWRQKFASQATQK